MPGRIPSASRSWNRAGLNWALAVSATLALHSLDDPEPPQSKLALAVDEVESTRRSLAEKEWKSTTRFTHGDTIDAAKDVIPKTASSRSPTENPDSQSYHHETHQQERMPKKGVLSLHNDGRWDHDTCRRPQLVNLLPKTPQTEV